MTVSGPIPARGVGEADRGAGPDAAFDAFAREHRQALVAIAWVLTGDVGAAEDVAQDTLNATWQAWDRGGGIHHPEAWARTVVANRAIDRVRRAARERRALGVVGSQPDPTVDLPTTDHEFWDAVRALPVLVTVVGFEVSEEAVLQVAEGLRPASAAEVAVARDEQVVAAPREFDDLADGYVVVASGDSQSGQWRIVADARRLDNIGALTIERLWGAIGSTVSTTGDRVEPPLDLAADVSDGTMVIWGLLWVDADSVTVESPGTEPVTLGIHDVEGWSNRVIAGSFPDDHFAGSDISVVARHADGREVARNSTVLSPDG